MRRGLGSARMWGVALLTAALSAVPMGSSEAAAKNCVTVKTCSVQGSAGRGAKVTVVSGVSIPYTVNRCGGGRCLTYSLHSAAGLPITSNIPGQPGVSLRFTVTLNGVGIAIMRTT